MPRLQAENGAAARGFLLIAGVVILAAGLACLAAVTINAGFLVLAAAIVGIAALAAGAMLIWLALS